MEINREQQIAYAEDLIKFLMWCEKENPTVSYGNVSISDAITAFSNLTNHPLDRMILISGVDNV